jgi:hypothetical protein
MFCSPKSLSVWPLSQNNVHSHIHNGVAWERLPSFQLRIFPFLWVPGMPPYLICKATTTSLHMLCKSLLHKPTCFSACDFISRCLVFKGHSSSWKVSTSQLTPRNCSRVELTSPGLTCFESKSCYDRWSADQSISFQELSAAQDQIYFYCQALADLSMCGTLSEERTGPSFETVAGPVHLFSLLCPSGVVAIFYCLSFETVTAGQVHVIYVPQE